MRTVTIRRYEELTHDQWRRVAAGVKRQVRRRTGQSSEVGIGRKYREGEPYGWQVAVRVYLTRKRKRVAEAKRIPRHFLVKLRSDDGRYNLLRIRSDVESLRDYVATSASVKLGRRQAASGFLLRWKGARGKTEWGFATVGHLFDSTPRRVTTVRVNATTTFQCRYLKATPISRRLDLAVMRVVGPASKTEARLRECGLIDRSNSAAIRFLSVSQIHRAATDHRRGISFSPDGDERFVGEEVFPDGFLLGNRRLDDCIRVGRADPGAFKQGTSGSYWRFGSSPACMQVGGKSPDFSEGIGQPFERFARWIRSSIDRSAKVVAVLDTVQANVKT